MARCLWRPLGVYAAVSAFVLLIQGTYFYPQFLVSFLFLYLPFLLIRMESKSSRSFGLDFRDWRFSDLVLALKVSGTVLLPYVLFHMLLFRERIQAASLSPDKIVALVLAEIFLVGLPEEVFFRGYLQTHLEIIFTKRFRFRGVVFGLAMILTAVLFTLSHFLLTKQFFSLAVFFPAMIFGWLKERTGRVLAPAIFHAFANVVYYFTPL